jgi:hypothetical protein
MKYLLAYFRKSYHMKYFGSNFILAENVNVHTKKKVHAFSLEKCKEKRTKIMKLIG